MARIIVIMLAMILSLLVEAEEVKEMTKKVKEHGQIFTPDYLVKDILDIAGYKVGDSVLQKHVIDNACGDGAFECEIVRRYIKSFYRRSSDKRQLAVELSTYIHGIELDTAAYNVCIAQLNRIVSDEEIEGVIWDIRNADTITVTDYDGKMDFVVGNPPYVRVHNLNDDFSRVKKFEFCNGGMTDLYLMFYELSFRMLHENGHLCFITASSWLNSLAGANMRKYIATNRCLKAVVDLGHFQPFNATTYTAIAHFVKGKKFDEIEYSHYNAPNNIKKVAKVPYEDAFFDNAIYLGVLNAVRDLKLIKTNSYPATVSVKNGFATLADPVFISNEFPFEQYVIPVIKASTGRWRKAFYPYDANGKPYAKSEIFANEKIAGYLNDHKSELLKGKDESHCPEWYLYGRTQALKDVWTKKYAINTVIKDASSVKLNLVPSGSGVYSGLYILTDIPEETLRAVLCSDDFVQYISMLKKYKSGGYYTFSSKELAQFLNFKLNQKKGE